MTAIDTAPLAGDRSALPAAAHALRGSAAVLASLMRARRRVSSPNGCSRAALAVGREHGRGGPEDRHGLIGRGSRPGPLRTTDLGLNQWAARVVFVLDAADGVCPPRTTRPPHDEPTQHPAKRRAGRGDDDRRRTSPPPRPRAGQRRLRGLGVGTGPPRGRSRALRPSARCRRRLRQRPPAPAGTDVRRHPHRPTPSQRSLGERALGRVLTALNASRASATTISTSCVLIRASVDRA